MATSSALQVTVSPSVVTSVSGVTLRAPSIVSTTPVQILLGAADETILTIVDPDTSNQSLFGLGTGAVDTGDKLLWKTVSGDSSDLTINPDGTWTWADMPSADVVIGLRIWDSSTETMGVSGQVTFDANGNSSVLKNVILRPVPLVQESVPTEIVQGSSVSFNLSGFATMPTSANTRVFVGGVNGYEPTNFLTSNVSGSEYQFVFTVPTDVVMLYGLKDILVVGEDKFTTITDVDFKPPIGYDYVEVANAELEAAWSVFNNHTGDVPLDGSQLVWTVNAIQAGYSAAYLPNGALHITVDGGGDVDLLSNIETEVYHISVNEEKGTTATKTYEVADSIEELVTDAVLPDVSITVHPDLTAEDVTTESTLDPVEVAVAHNVGVTDLASDVHVDTVSTIARILLINDLASFTHISNVPVTARYLVEIDDLTTTSVTDEVNVVRRIPVFVDDITTDTHIDNVKAGDFQFVDVYPNRVKYEFLNTEYVLEQITN